MANVFVTNTARFNPFSYQELAAPLMQASEMQYALEDTLSNMDDGTIESYLAGEKSDSPYVTRYNALIDRLKSASTELASKGISPGLIRDIKALSGDYKKFTTPVEAAGKRKAADISAYNKMLASGEVPIGDNPNEIPLDAYMSNASYSARYTSGDKLMAKGMLLGKELANNFTPTFTPVMGGKYYEMQSKRTATIDEIQNSPEFKSSIDALMIQSGFDPNSDDAYTKQARRAIEMGVFNNMQDPGIDYKVNPGYNTSRNSSTTHKKLGEGWNKIDGYDGYFKIGGTDKNRTILFRQDENDEPTFVTDENLRKEILEKAGYNLGGGSKPPKNSGVTGSVSWGKPTDQSKEGWIYKPAEESLAEISEDNPLTIMSEYDMQDDLNNIREHLPYEEGYIYGKDSDGHIYKISQAQYDKLKKDNNNNSNVIINPSDSSLKVPEKEPSWWQKRRDARNQPKKEDTNPKLQ